MAQTNDGGVLTNRAVLVLAVVFSIVGFEAFMTLDWDHGIARSLVVMAVLAVMAVTIKAHPIQRAWPRWSLALVSMGVGLLLLWHIKEGALSAIRQRHSEMGDIHARAVALLWHGVTPWHFGTVLDSGSFGSFVSWPNLAACRSTAEPPTQTSLDAMWNSPSESGAVFFARDAQQQPCGHWFAQAGYKYGPAMLAAYVPLVSFWGRSGVYITHLIFLFAILAAIAVLLRDRRPEAILAAFAVVLGQSLLRRDTLYESDCDLIPTALMLLSLVSFERSRPFATGVFVALTLAAKIFPGVFVLPLLVLCSNRSRALGAFTLVSAAFWGAAIAADGTGVWANVFQFNLERGSDSTALAFFVPGWASTLLPSGALLAMAVLAVLAMKRRIDLIAFCAFAMGIFFVSAKVLHNNYFVWWLPLVALTLARAQVPLRTEMEATQ